MNNIDNTKYNLYSLKLNKDNSNFPPIEYIKSFDVIFPIIHGKTGEDGKLQGLLDTFNIKYVGSKCLESAICMDKSLSKIVFDKLNIPQVPYIYFKDKMPNIPFSFPMIIKPANGGSSIGINIATNKKELKEAIKIAKKYDQKIIIEKFIEAQELECAILQTNKLLISEIGEIISTNKFYDYEAKYENDSETIIPANIPKNIKTQIQKYAKKVFKELNLKNLARIDFFYDKEKNQIYINEINTLPGFTTISMYPKLLMHNKLTLKQIITSLIEFSN